MSANINNLDRNNEDKNQAHFPISKDKLMQDLVDFGSEYKTHFSIKENELSFDNSIPKNEGIISNNYQTLDENILLNEKDILSDQSPHNLNQNLSSDLDDIFDRLDKLENKTEFFYRLPKNIQKAVLDKYHNSVQIFEELDTQTQIEYLDNLTVEEKENLLISVSPQSLKEIDIINKFFEEEVLEDITNIDKDKIIKIAENSISKYNQNLLKEIRKNKKYDNMSISEVRENVSPENWTQILTNSFGDISNFSNDTGTRASSSYLDIKKHIGTSRSKTVFDTTQDIDSTPPSILFDIDQNIKPNKYIVTPNIKDTGYSYDINPLKQKIKSNRLKTEISDTQNDRDINKTINNQITENIKYMNNNVSNDTKNIFSTMRGRNTVAKTTSSPLSFIVRTYFIAGGSTGALAITGGIASSQGVEKIASIGAEIFDIILSVIT